MYAPGLHSMSFSMCCAIQGVYRNWGGGGKCLQLIVWGSGVLYKPECYIRIIGTTIFLYLQNKMFAMNVSVITNSDFSFKDHCPQIFHFHISSTTFNVLLLFLSLNTQKVNIHFLNIQYLVISW